MIVLDGSGVPVTASEVSEVTLFIGVSVTVSRADGEMKALAGCV